MELKVKLVLAIILFAFLNCNQTSTTDRYVDSGNESLVNIDTLCIKKKDIIESIINNPDFIKYSRVRNVKNSFDKIFIFFDSISQCRFPPFVQEDDTLEVINNVVSSQILTSPVYEIKDIKIIADSSAYVHVEFDLSGAIAYGNLNYCDGLWVVSDDFVIGVR